MEKRLKLRHGHFSFIHGWSALPDRLYDGLVTHGAISKSGNRFHISHPLAYKRRVMPSGGSISHEAMTTDIAMTIQAATATPVQSSSPLSRETIDGIAVLTLDSPKSRNALSEAMIASLQAQLDSIREDKNDPRRCHCSEWSCVFFGTRSQGTDRTPRRPGQWPRLFRADHDGLQHDDADHCASPQTRGRRRTGSRHCRRLPARCNLRSCGGLRARQPSQRLASTSACSARPPWSHCRATFRASTRCICC